MKAILSILLLFLSILTTSCVERKHIKHQSDWYLATQDIVQQYTPTFNKYLLTHFQRAGVSFPPKRLALIALKKEKTLELWAQQNRQWHLIKKYPIRAESGGPGPKLKQNDAQIPEGVYKITALNPFSSLHLSMQINYPNAFDRQHAKLDGRAHLGGDIFIHGRTVSAGCLAVGDRAIEELFVMVAKAGKRKIKVVIAPNDLRIAPPLAPKNKHIPWVNILDTRIARALKPFNRA